MLARGRGHHGGDERRWELGGGTDIERKSDNNKPQAGVEQ
jgi:hypothetical protein